MVASLARPDFSPGFVDRYLIVAAASDLPLLLVLNKADLVDELPEAVQEFEGLADRMVLVSAETGQGLEELRALLVGRVSVLTGHSGVGKSTLVKALLPGVELDTGEVREKDGKGRHTTIASSVWDLPGGGSVIDTPGIRGLGFWNMEPELLPLLFPPFKQWVGACKFNDCQHLEEPGCAIHAALEAGELPERFYESYLRILDSL